MSKQLVYLVAGGPGGEHEVSLSTAKSVKENLDESKYEVVEVLMRKDSKWVIEGETMSSGDGVKCLAPDSVVFIALHGKFGEDGQLQELLDGVSVRYTGSGSVASKLAFDKESSDKVYKERDLAVPKTQVMNSNKDQIELKLPFVVKPAREGSSVGVSLCKTKDDINKALESAFNHDDKVLVQQYIKGPEISCGVLENPGPKALTPTQIVPKSEFYDYEAKYSEGQSEHLLPPDLDKKLLEKIQKYSVEAHEALGCRGYSRTDFLVEGDKLYVLETNTLPGMTKTSLFPEQAQYDGIPFSELLDILISNASHD